MATIKVILWCVLILAGVAAGLLVLLSVPVLVILLVNHLQPPNDKSATNQDQNFDLLPQADAESIMGKALVTQRNDAWGCHYQDAVGTAGTGLMLDLNVLAVSDQCRLTPESEPLSGLRRMARQAALAAAPAAGA